MFFFLYIFHLRYYLILIPLLVMIFMPETTDMKNNSIKLIAHLTISQGGG